MMLDAARAAELALTTVEAGGSVASVLVVGDPSGAALGRRLLVLHSGADGAEQTHGGLGSAAMDAAARALALQALEDPSITDGLHTLATEAGPVEAYLEVRRPVRDLVIVGAGHIAQPLCAIGAMLGFRVSVLDDRPDFATQERFPQASRIFQADFSDPFRDVAIHAGSHVLLVTRGHRYDYQCLVRILRADPRPAYVGMIGSRRRVRATFEQLLQDGVARDRLGDVHAPVGLDIGAETPEEIAVAVAAELVSVARGGTGASLKDVERVAERFFKETESSR
jgi:xanthine dehydrogenase accessory factor